MDKHIAVLEEMLRDLGENYPDMVTEDEQEALRAAIALMRGQLWQDIATIPRDGTRVELLSANGKTDCGNWYDFSDWAEPSDDVQDHLNTDNGEGDYTHWRPAKGLSR